MIATFSDVRKADMDDSLYWRGVNLTWEEHHWCLSEDYFISFARPPSPSAFAVGVMLFLPVLTRAKACRGSRAFATAVGNRIPQTVIEKVVQKYAVGLPEGTVVKAGDYVMIRPEHVMTHDNTGPVISKCAFFSFVLYTQLLIYGAIGSMV